MGRRTSFTNLVYINQKIEKEILLENTKHVKLQLRDRYTETTLKANFSKSWGSLHSMDSANACGALGRGFESLRARFYKVQFMVPICGFTELVKNLYFHNRFFS